MQKNISKFKLTNKRRDMIAGWLFCLPFISGFLFFFISPIITYFTMSFSNMILNDSGNLQFIPVGFENYYDAIFVQEDYIPKVFSNVADLFIMFPAILLFSFFMALLLNQKFHGRALARVILFLPVVIASGVTAVSQSDALMSAAVSAVSNGGSDSTGTVNLVQSITKIFGDTMNASFFSIIQALVKKINITVMSSGVQILIFLSGLQTISPSLYEASALEGATAWEDFWKITFPIMSPIFLVNAVYTIVDVMGSTSNSLVNDLYNLSINKMEYGLSAAMGVVYFGIALLFVGIAIAVISKMVFYEER